ncbi:MAG: RecX family transcriptional regulator [Ignavibacteriaceae bacterium]|nr:RecX family transcriptional regulator [Ignavibacteriaceae bacterium]
MKILCAVRKGSSDVKIELDNGENLYLSYEVFLKSGLRKNDEISEDRFSFFVEENKLHHIKQRAYKLLARRLHSEYELRQKLKQKDYSKHLIDKVIDELLDKKYLNDAEFANQYAAENIKNKLWGEKKLTAELMRRGISKNNIYDVVADKFPQGNDIDNADKLAEKKYKQLSYKNFERLKLMQKIIAFLLGKGYDYETAKQAAENVVPMDENKSDWE